MIANLSTLMRGIFVHDSLRRARSASNRGRNSAEWLESRQLLTADTFSVVNVNDSGTGSFRWALEQANTDPNVTTITFQIPGAGSHVIQPLSSLPQDRKSVV